MMERKYLFVPLTLGLGLMLALLWSLGSTNMSTVLASPVTETTAAEWHVCPAGPPACEYSSIQAAVDAAAAGDVIKVAQGTYADIHSRVGISQVVYISKTVTVQGGYTTTDWTTPDPALHATTLDAQILGRVMVISGVITPTVEGLHLTGGRAWGSLVKSENSGGGILVRRAAPTIRNCVIVSNSAVYGYGGGLFLENADHSTLEDNVVAGNDATSADGGGVSFWGSNNALLTGNVISGNLVYYGSGGGVHFRESDNVTLRGNTISHNIAAGSGGGLYVFDCDDATLSDNIVYSNTASLAGKGYGGGLYLGYLAGLSMASNTVQGNKASVAGTGYGGGLYLEQTSGAVTLTGNRILSNTASTAGHGWGGGACFWNVDDATLDSNTVQGNRASISGGGYSGNGGGLEIYYSDNLALNDNTFVGNTAGTSGDSWGGALGLEFSHHAVLSGNTVRGNVANSTGKGTGGGLYIELSDHAALSGNVIVSNTAALNPAAVGWGGGLVLESCRAFTLTNNVVAANQANSQGSGLWFEGDGGNPTSGRLLHTTIADNHSSGQGVFLAPHVTLALTNTIIAGHAGVGITVTAGSTATQEATLWHNSGLDVGGGGRVTTGTVNIQGDPAFVDPSAWDYHLTEGSPAINAGVDAGVTTDIDGQARDADPDIGADEFGPTGWSIYLPLVVKSG